MDLILSKPFKIGAMPPTWSLIVARGPLKGRCESVGFKSVSEAKTWATELGHKIVARERK
jgi:hypothetical protein